MRDDTYWEAEKMTRMVVSGVSADITMAVVFGEGNVVRLSREQLRHLIFSLERRLATRSDDEARPGATEWLVGRYFSTAHSPTSTTASTSSSANTTGRPAPGVRSSGRRVTWQPIAGLVLAWALGASLGCPFVPPLMAPGIRGEGLQVAGRGTGGTTRDASMKLRVGYLITRAGRPHDPR